MGHTYKNILMNSYVLNSNLYQWSINMRNVKYKQKHKVMQYTRSKDELFGKLLSFLKSFVSIEAK